MQDRSIWTINLGHVPNLDLRRVQRFSRFQFAINTVPGRKDSSSGKMDQFKRAVIVRHGGQTGYNRLDEFGLGRGRGVEVEVEVNLGVDTDPVTKTLHVKTTFPGRFKQSKHQQNTSNPYVIPVNPVKFLLLLIAALLLGAYIR